VPKVPAAPLIGWKYMDELWLAYWNYSILKVGKAVVCKRWRDW
jgi:hypothetical protein